MFRSLVAAIALLALTGCSTLSSISTISHATSNALSLTVTQKQAGVTLAIYEGLQDPAITYLEARPCALGQTFLQNGCREAGTAALLNAALDKGDAAAKALRDAIVTAQKSGTNVGVAPAVVQAVKNATSDVTAATPTAKKG